MKKGCKYGTHRVISPKGVLPQTADIVDNNVDEIFDNEILINVDALNIDSASFTQLKEEANGDKEVIKSRIYEIIKKHGKMKNPVTGSGGVLLGTVEKIGEGLDGKTGLCVGDRIITLVSLSLTPLKLNKIHEIHEDIDRVDVDAKAILFESGLFGKIPNDIPEAIVMAALDVAGAPAQTAKLVKENNKVLVFGAGGKSGILCCYEAMKKVGKNGKVVGIEKDIENANRLKALGFCHEVIVADAQNPVEVLSKSLEVTDGQEYDISINCLNVPNCEMSCSMPVKDEGIVYFFSMATSFTKAALGVEGIGKDITMIIGNGYTKGHAELTLQDLRENEKLMKLFRDEYIG